MIQGAFPDHYFKPKEKVQIYDKGISSNLHHIGLGSSLPEVFASESISYKTSRLKIS